MNLERRKPFFRLMTALCAATLLWSCNDRDDVIDPTEDDAFVGEQRVITLGAEMEDFGYSEYVCYIKAEDGTIIKRRGVHSREGEESRLMLNTGLRAGTYRLLALDVPVEVHGSDTTWVEYGLGCRIRIADAASTPTVLDSYDKVMKMTGDGSENNPYIISSSDHLKRLRMIANDGARNNQLRVDAHYQQVADIKMGNASYSTDSEFGWDPIGNHTSNPFRGKYDGGGYKIIGMWIKRPHSACAGLFGFVDNASLKNIVMDEPNVEGNYAVGSLVGGTTSVGDARDQTYIHGCITSGGYVTGSAGSIGVGGIVGVVNLNGLIVLDSCFNRNTPVTGDYAVGGILGAGTVYSRVEVQQSDNSGAISARYTGAGGIVGSVDSLMVNGCVNTANITGGINAMSGDMSNGGYGAGGIAGGTGVSFINTSLNSGNIAGAIGVGGIIGSTRVGNDDSNYSTNGEPDLMMNNTIVKGCGNSGNVSGLSSVGGVCGEAQFGCFSVYNTGEVNATGSNSQVGGIAGNTSIAVAHNAVNSGKVTCSNGEAAGGVIGKTCWGTVFACQNFGTVDVGASRAGGIIGLAGNYTVANYCINGGYVSNKQNGPTGGIVGEIGDPREWTASNIMSCVIGSMECVMGIVGPCLAVAGYAIEATPDAFSKAMKSLEHVMHIAESTIDWTLTTIDVVTLAQGTYAMITEEEADEMNSSLKVKTTDISNSVRTTMKSLSAGFQLETAMMPTELDATLTSTAFANYDDVITFYETSDENNSAINYNLNLVRDERKGEIEERKEVKEIVQKSIAGACIAIAATAAVAGFFTGGATAVIVGVAGGVATFVGGANAIVEGTTDFTANAIIVSQCTNMAKIKSTNSSVTGGIVGMLAQNGQLYDCLNMGSLDVSSSSDNKNSGGIVGHASSMSEVMRCLNLGNRWYATHVAIPDMRKDDDNYAYEKVDFCTGSTSGYFCKFLSIDKLHSASSYNNWSLSGDLPFWSLKDEKGCFPVPAKSRMQQPL